MNMKKKTKKTKVTLSLVLFFTLSSCSPPKTSELIYRGAVPDSFTVTQTAVGPQIKFFGSYSQPQWQAQLASDDDIEIVDAFSTGNRMIVTGSFRLELQLQDTTWQTIGSEIATFVVALNLATGEWLWTVVFETSTVQATPIRMLSDSASIDLQLKVGQAFQNVNLNFETLESGQMPNGFQRPIVIESDFDLYRALYFNQQERSPFRNKPIVDHNGSTQDPKGTDPDGGN